MKGTASFTRVTSRARGRSIRAGGADVRKDGQSAGIQLQSALNVAKADIKVGRAAAALPRLRELIKRAETLRLRPLVAEGTVLSG